MKMIFYRIREQYQNVPVQVKASFWFLICAFLQKGISAITTPIFTRLMSTGEYGQYNIFNSWLGILTVCISLNLYCGVYSRGLVKFEQDRKAFISSFQGLSLTLILGWLLVYLAFNSFWNELLSLTTPQMLCMFVLIWSTNAFGFWAMEQRVDYRYKKLVLVTLIISLTKPILGVVLVKLAKDKVTARVFGLAIVEFMVCIILFWEQMKKGKVFFSIKYWKHAFAFNIPLIPHYLSSTVLSSADRIMIGDMVNESSAGIYGLAYSISLIMTMFNSAFTQTIEPWMFKRINEKRIKDISKVAYLSLSFIAFVNLALIAFAPEVVSLFAPPAYYDAIWVIPPVAMSVFFMFSYHLFSVFEFYFEKTKMITVATSAGAVLNIFLNYIFIKQFGYYAAGYTTLLCYIIYAAFHFMFMRKICREQFEGQQPYSAKIYAMIAGVFLCLSFILLFSYRHRLLRYGIICILMLFIFLLRKHIIGAVMDLLRIRQKSAGGKN